MKHSRCRGRACLNCNQYAMGHELRDHGKKCVFCPPVAPDVLEGEEIMNTEHKLALDEARRRRRSERKKRG